MIDLCQNPEPASCSWCRQADCRCDCSAFDADFISQGLAAAVMIDQEALRKIDLQFEDLIEKERTGIRARIARVKAGNIEPRDLPYIRDYGGVEGFVSHMCSSDNGVRIAAIIWQNLVNGLRDLAEHGCEGCGDDSRVCGC